MLHHVIIGEGHPVLILHGARLDHRHMRESLEPVFAQRSHWQRIYVDLPGHGLSPAQNDICSQDDLLAAVIDFTAELLPGQKFAIIGESRGSYLARGMVNLLPKRVSGVVLIVPGGNPNSDPQRLPPHQIMQPDPSIRPQLEEDEMHSFDSMMVVQNWQIIEKRRRTKIPAIKLWDADQESRVFQKFEFEHEKQQELSHFAGPSLIIAGRQDSMSGYLDAIDLTQAYSRSSTAVLDLAGHGLTWERPNLFNALMEDWLDRLLVEL